MTLQSDILASTTAPDAFARCGYVVLPALIEAPLADFLWSYVHVRFASGGMTRGDRRFPNTPSAYGDPAFEGLLEHLRPRVAAAVGLRLLPTYSYVRLYKRGDALKRHRDRPACEISVSLNLGQTPGIPWPLHVAGPGGDFAARLSPGDGLAYRGVDCAHWRDPFEGERLVQAFLHYVDADGPHRDQKFDGRAMLMQPRTPDGAEDQAADA